MDDIQRFLAHAIQLERESARRYEELAEAMQSLGSMEVAEFFRQMAHYSRLHLKEAMQRGGFHDLPELAPDAYEWPEGTSPEAAAWAGVDGFMDVPGALALALDGERRSYDYYRSIAETAQDPEVKRMAEAFAEEEAEHVAQLESWRSGLAKG
ncbi:Rubrerythrin [Azotobacter beijerinckii]|uniref:Rubrerythrin n=1 Tax=Azotobacter beijerinckii TaxID=170623 RepID=A0A1H9GAQ1_9GAMM|nr:ferritin family protein [Azotobacter beijerinckii]SEQ46838.1 Rubrerythrin [Azotobacter beijerinckii]